MSDFIFLGSKITTDGDCSHEIKRLLLLGRKVMTNLDSTFKSRDITLPTKVRLVKAMVFPVVMCGERAPPVAKGMRKEAWHTQRQDQASGVSLEILEHLPPKPESAYFLFCALTYTSEFTGGCPPLPLSEKRVSLQLQLIIPGCDSVSIYKLLWKSSSLPEWVFPATCDCSEPPNCERQEMF